MSNGVDTDKKKKDSTKSKMPVLVIGICVVIIAILAVAIVYLLNSRQEPAMAPDKGNLIVDESNLETIEDQLKDSVQDGMFQMNMNTTWRFKEGDPTSGNAYVANAAANHYPISFEVYLNGEEEIYSSTLMPVGTQLKELSLNKELPKGQYDAVCTYHLWDENEEEVGSFGVNIIISVE